MGDEWYLPRRELQPEGARHLWIGEYLLCRHCCDLAYQSQRDNVMYRTLHRSQDIRQRLDGSANMMEPFPGKLKGMHWRAYERLWWAHHEVEMKRLASMKEWQGKLERRL